MHHFFYSILINCTPLFHKMNPNIRFVIGLCVVLCKYLNGSNLFPILVVMKKGILVAVIPSNLPSCPLKRQGDQPEYVENILDIE